MSDLLSIALILNTAAQLIAIGQREAQRRHLARQAKNVANKGVSP